MREGPACMSVEAVFKCAHQGFRENILNLQPCTQMTDFSDFVCAALVGSPLGLLIVPRIQA